MNIEVRKVDEKYMNVVVNIDSSTKSDLGLFDEEERIEFIRHLAEVIMDLTN